MEEAAEKLHSTVLARAADCSVEHVEQTLTELETGIIPQEEIFAVLDDSLRERLAHTYADHDLLDLPLAYTADTELDDERGKADVDIQNRPSDVPAKATKTIKTINDNRYWYWQWRDDNSIESKYIGPVDYADSSDVN